MLFDAEHCYEMIDWQATTISEPPATHCLSNATIKGYIKSRMLPSELFPKFPYHTLEVERDVKLVTKAAACVVDSSERDGYIITKLQSRKKMPTLTQRKTLSFKQTTPNQL